MNFHLAAQQRESPELRYSLPIHFCWPVLAWHVDLGGTKLLGGLTSRDVCHDPAQAAVVEALQIYALLKRPYIN